MEQLAEADLPPETGAHRLICGDCLSVLPTLEAETVDVVVTSPPYNSVCPTVATTTGGPRMNTWIG